MPVFIFIFLVLLLIYIWLINYYKRHWERIPEYATTSKFMRSDPNHDDYAVAVSVVIAIRNEEHNLRRLIKNLLGQELAADFEIVVVDDHSEDNSLELINDFASKYDNIKSISLPIDVRGKKHAIQAGIRAASAEIIVTTDADCEFGPHWLNTLTAFFVQRNATFVAAPVRMVSPDTFLGIFQRLDFLALQGITAAAVDSGLHCMCNGANLAYSRDAFFRVGGFQGIDHIPSGDDMLLMYKIFRNSPQSVYYLKSKDAIVTTAAETTWKKFFHQRIRWASKSTHYQEKKIFWVLALTYSVNLSFVILAAACIINASWLWILSLFLLMKLLGEFPFMSSVATFFGDRRLLWLFPFFQPLHIVYIVVSGWFGTFGKYEWKSRSISNNVPKVAKQ